MPKQKQKKNSTGSSLSAAKNLTLTSSHAHAIEKNESTLKKFEEIRAKNEEKAKSIISNDYESSSDEENLNEREILDGIFRNYSGNHQQLSKIQTFLENFLQSGSAICLICIGTVKRTDSICSCKNCYCFFHLNCLKRWSNDSIALQKLNADQNQSYYNNQGEFIQKKVKPIRWCCPKCRKDYPPNDIPKQYECFCSKEVNPHNHPWLIPHSCGEKCEKYLEPECGHKCLLLCHPGPCPPCPQNLTISCKCEKSAPKTIRCFQQSWSCESKCQKILNCGIHKCAQICHLNGKCPPCTKQSKQKCQCGNEIAERNCSQLKWQCKKVCNKPLYCRLHKCRRVCHSDDCGDCPLGLPRACPCGKSKTIAPCSEVIDTCGDTCQKVLACNMHYCTQRCHKGDCSLCLAIVEKKCRCGLHTKEQPCSKIFTCETKCKLMRECQKHACNKKCCDGQCPPCDKVCNKTLSCKKHKCKSICHDGPCYPCDLKSSVKCRCGNTSVTVPCGREKKTKTPKCLQLCRIPSKCHHENPHKCHMNDCPLCVQKCGLLTSNCNHLCEAKCHDAVKVEIKNPKVTTIWDWQHETFEYKQMPHPQCTIPVMVTCIGGHETVNWPCWNSKPSSCERECGRQLKCGNHICTRICHSVPDLLLPNEQEGCIPCTEECKITQPEGCIHPCRKRCHPPPCDICTVNIKASCHCGLTLVYYKCNDFYLPDISGNSLIEKREKLKSCGNRCIKNYVCGHRCTAVCHSGICPNPENCKKKMKIYCLCKNLKMDISCEKNRNGLKFMECDDTCAKKKAEENRIKQEIETKQKQLEEEKNRIELEQFEKKFGKKKYKDRKTTEITPKDNNNLKILLIIGGCFAVFAVFVILYILN